MPVTSPAVPTVALPTELLLHVPPGVGFDRVVVAPSHNVTAPAGVIATGAGLTVSDNVAVQPATDVFVIVVVPGATAVTIPEEDPIVATAELLLLQLLPPAELNVVLSPAHTVEEPVIGPGKGFTVIDIVDVQPPL
jgi:hypothetical protein